eukprot:GHVH01001844.1.p1 GENE.GHVH01001844.1~~GHVH01001844.1.p1  ORF type:complete len:424 (-),score=67.41 GHVH01001844.1:729-2000(-)
MTDQSLPYYKQDGIKRRGINVRSVLLCCLFLSLSFTSGWITNRVSGRISSLPKEVDSELEGGLISELEGGLIDKNVSRITVDGQVRLMSDNVSVVITASSSDWFLLPLPLQSILNQTILPKEVIIVISNSSDLGTYQGYPYPFTLTDSSNDTMTGGDALLEAIGGRLPQDPDSEDVQDSERSSEAVLIDTIHVLDRYLNTGTLIKSIPNLKLITNPKNSYAGENRQAGVRFASGDVVSFFDSDDLMHPKRIEYLHAVFNHHPEVDLLVHSFEYAYIHDFKTRHDQWLSEAMEPPLEVDHYGRVNEIKTHLDESHDPTKSTWKWFFPDKRIIASNQDIYQRSFHNGWLSGRREVFKKGTFFNNPRGQDSRFLYHLVKNKGASLSVLTSKLGLYVRPNGPKRRRAIEQAMMKAWNRDMHVLDNLN